MKSLWKCLIQSTMIIGASTCSSAVLLADDAGQVGFVRISKPKSTNGDAARILPVSASQISGSGCVATCAPPNESAACDSGACPVYCDAGPICDDSCYVGRKRRRRDWGRTGRDEFDCYGNAGYGNVGYAGAGYGRSGRGRCRSGNCDGPGGLGHGWHAGYGLGLHGGYGDCQDGSGDCQAGCGYGCSHQAMLDYFRCKFGYFIPSGGGGKGVPCFGHYSRVYPQNPYYGDSRDSQAWAAQGYGVPMAVPLAPVVGHTFEYSVGIPSSRLTPISYPAY